MLGLNCGIGIENFELRKNLDLLQLYLFIILFLFSLRINICIDEHNE